MAIFRITNVMDDERLREEIKSPLTDSCPIVVFAEEKTTAPALRVRFVLAFGSSNQWSDS